MVEVQLLTHDLRPLKRVSLPPHAKRPEVICWDDRIFVACDDLRYKEAHAWWASISLDRQAEAA